jgi:hypothetical protein
MSSQRAAMRCAAAVRRRRRLRLRRVRYRQHRDLLRRLGELPVQTERCVNNTTLN